MSDPDAVLLDPAAAYPEVTDLRAGLAARDWAAVRAVLDAAPGPVARTMLLRIGAGLDRKNTEGLEAFLRHAANSDARDGSAAAMLAFHLIDIGWEVRSGYRAEHVSRSQFATFHEWLRLAETVLREAIARHPHDPALWVARLTSARGLELGPAETRRRYDKLTAVDPHHLPGQIQFLQSLCPKWSGSWELLHPWCREAMLAAPPGAPQGGLVADGHLEHWMEIGGGGVGKTYLTTVRGELHEAAERSVWHPDFGREHGWTYAANYFAMAFSLLDDQPAARRTFELLGNLGQEMPWQYLSGDVASVILRHRKRALGGKR
nr:hypothetical protein [uncultured Actinoplanes sp.]